jgi:hypothetical protein
MDFTSVVLLGLDSFIACLAIGPIVASRWRVPLAVLFGAADGAGFLAGTALGWHVPDAMASALKSGVLLLFGVYLIAVTLMTSHVAARWPIWVLPFALTLDNLTFGLVGDDNGAGSPLAQAGYQALASGALALVGLLVAAVLPRVSTRFEQQRTSSALAGGALVVASGLVLLG